MLGFFLPVIKLGIQSMQENLCKKIYARKSMQKKGDGILIPSPDLHLSVTVGQ
jgi:hypothetical protein